jgi:outer membrane receptor protein involved in Fe transport
MIEYTFGAYPENPKDVPTLNDIGFKALNIGTARITGIELSASGQGQLGPARLLFNGGYTFMNPVDPQVIEKEGKGEDEAYILKYRRRNLLKGDLEVTLWHIIAGTNLLYNSRMVNVDEVFIDPLVGNLLQPGFPGYWQEHSNGYTLVDLRLGWNITKGLRINTWADPGT